MMRYWDTDDWIFFSIKVALIGIPLFFAIDFFTGKKNEHTGKIHEMTFVHGNQTTTVGTVVTSNGGVGTVVANSGQPDEWSMIVNVNDFYAKVECSPNGYYHHKIGDQVKLIQRVGSITGIAYSSYLKE